MGRDFQEIWDDACHALQKEYGFKDEEILSLARHVFFRKLKAITRAKESALEEQLFLADYQTYLNYIIQPSYSKKDKKMTFEEWRNVLSFKKDDAKTQVMNEEHLAERKRIAREMTERVESLAHEFEF